MKKTIFTLMTLNSLALADVTFNWGIQYDKIDEKSGKSISFELSTSIVNVDLKLATFDGHSKRVYLIGKEFGLHKRLSIVPMMGVSSMASGSNDKNPIEAEQFFSYGLKTNFFINRNHAIYAEIFSLNETTLSIGYKYIFRDIVKKHDN